MTGNSAVAMLSIATGGKVWCIAEVGPRSSLTAMHYSMIPPEHFHIIKRAFFNHVNGMHLGWMV